MFSGNLFAINGYENCPMVDGKIDASELVNIVPYSVLQGPAMRRSQISF